MLHTFTNTHISITISLSVYVAEFQRLSNHGQDPRQNGICVHIHYLTKENMPSVFLDPAFHICRIGLHEAGKGHIQIRFCLVELFPLPRQCFPFCQKASLCRLLPFSLPIGITIVDLPCVCFRFLVDCHSNHFLSLFSAVP